MALHEPRSLSFALPDHQDSPPGLAQAAGGFLIPGDVGCKLGFPERNVGFRQVREFAGAMAMPEAAMHEHRNAVAFQHDVWSTWKVAIMKPKPVAEPVKERPDGYLGCRVAGLDFGHVPASVSRGCRRGEGALGGHVRASQDRRRHERFDAPATEVRRSLSGYIRTFWSRKSSNCRETFEASPPPS